ncbi:hypothetical protein BDV18DRAFT_163014 [Aspergillus unguis]
MAVLTPLIKPTSPILSPVSNDPPPFYWHIRTPPRSPLSPPLSDTSSTESEPEPKTPTQYPPERKRLTAILKPIDTTLTSDDNNVISPLDLGSPFVRTRSATPSPEPMLGPRPVEDERVHILDEDLDVRDAVRLRAWAESEWHARGQNFHLNLDLDREHGQNQGLLQDYWNGQDRHFYECDKDRGGLRGSSGSSGSKRSFDELLGLESEERDTEIRAKIQRRPGMQYQYGNMKQAGNRSCLC